MPTTQIGTIIHKTGLNIDESYVLVLPVHLHETGHVSFQTRCVSFLSRLVETCRSSRLVSRDGGNLLLSGAVLLIKFVLLLIIFQVLFLLLVSNLEF